MVLHIKFTTNIHTPVIPLLPASTRYVTPFLEKCFTEISLKSTFVFRRSVTWFTLVIGHFSLSNLNS